MRFISVCLLSVSALSIYLCPSVKAETTFSYVAKITDGAFGQGLSVSVPLTNRVTFNSAVHKTENKANISGVFNYNLVDAKVLNQFNPYFGIGLDVVDNGANKIAVVGVNYKNSNGFAVGAAYETALEAKSRNSYLLSLGYALAF